MKKLILIGVVVLVSMLGAQTVLAECFIGGNITASPNPNLDGPHWIYSMIINWDTGNNYSLSHVDLLMDESGGTCSCQDFMAALSWEDPVGHSEDTPGACNVNYQGFLECKGDPSIPGVDNILLKFEPIESDCEPGPSGMATFFFYSDLPPVPIDEEVLSVVDKHALQYCFGYLSGDFPAMTCDPVSNEDTSWGSLKGMYR